MKDHFQATFDATMASAASKATGTGAAASVAGWAVGSDVGVWAGIVIGSLGLLIKWYYEMKSDRRAAEADRRAEEVHRAQMRAVWGDLKDKPADNLDRAEGGR